MGNVIIITGRLGKDPEQVPTKSGTPMCKFSLATDDGYGDNKKTNWHRVKVFGKTAEHCMTYLTKGRMVQVVGRIEYDKYDKNGVTMYTADVIANTVEFIGGKQGQVATEDSSSNLTQNVGTVVNNADNLAADGGGADDDDLPF